ncbi:MAG TPA: urocanate hydratase, partial [Bacteroidetes bacterium]|nr:urocanate hydratase [Bacteroidota bacterium]
MANKLQDFQAEILEGIPAQLPDLRPISPNFPHPKGRKHDLDVRGKKLALKNALRYFDVEHHAVLAPEFANELEQYGRIYMYRFRPNAPIFARPIGDYPAQCQQAAAIMLMLQNNLDPAVAQFPEELITYGGNGSVLQNWAQYRLIMAYLAQMTDQQTLIIYSGHPLGLFPSNPEAPRVVVTNGMMIPNFSKPEWYDKYNALGVTQYGQMTAGSFMYIGPQGIVHGTTITLLNAGRRFRPGAKRLNGMVYVTSGMGGMSGAQPKAAVIAGAIGVVAEINPEAAYKRKEQGWLDELYEDLDTLAARIRTAKANKEAVSIGYLGNIVDLWEKLIADKVPVELGSDQTSLHNPFGGGYYPVGMSFAESEVMMREDPAQFKQEVYRSLRRHAAAIGEMTRLGMYFWDYGNAFLLEAGRAGAEITKEDGAFIYPSYVEDIMGPLCFDFGFGPFRWVCTAGTVEDLRTTDRIAAEVLSEIAASAPDEIRLQLEDNIHWIKEAESNRLVVGSKARILYADSEGRIRIAKRFNAAVRSGELAAPVVLGRDHHDVSGTDSPYRETANIYDGSAVTADMAVQNFVGDGFRGATWISLHNGGGVGWGEVMNGGFGLVLD